MRIKIESPEQYYSMVNDAKKNWGRLQNNAYFLPECLETQIEQGRLSALFLNDALFFFLDCGSYEQLYFHASKNIVSDTPTTDHMSEIQKPVVADLIGIVSPDCLAVSGTEDHFPAENIPSKLQPNCILLEKYRMKRMDCYYHMSAAAICKPVVSAPSGFFFSPAVSEQIPEILALLNASFSPIASDLPDAEELASLIRHGESFSLADASGTLCGYCQYEAQGSQRMLRHLVIASKYRGHHLSDYILQNLSERFPKNPSFLWVKEDNAAASRLYHTWGYRFDGRILIHYFIE